MAAKVAAGFAADPQVLAVAGHFNSTCTLAGKPIYTNAKLSVLTPGSMDVRVCKESRWLFRGLYDDHQHARSPSSCTRSSRRRAWSCSTTTTTEADKTKDVEVILVAGLYGEAAQIAKACRKAGLTR